MRDQGPEGDHGHFFRDRGSFRGPGQKPTVRKITDGGYQLRAFDKPSLSVRKAVKLINQVVNLGVGCRDLAFHAVELP